MRDMCDCGAKAGTDRFYKCEIERLEELTSGYEQLIDDLLDRAEKAEARMVALIGPGGDVTPEDEAGLTAVGKMLRGLRARVKTAEAERDEASAQVERLREALATLRGCLKAEPTMGGPLRNAHVCDREHLPDAMRQADGVLFALANTTPAPGLHADHGRGDDSGPEHSDCGCRGTSAQRECAEAGCGFCRCRGPAPEPDTVTLTREEARQVVEALSPLLLDDSYPSSEVERLKADLASAAERLDEFGSCPTVADGIQAMRLRLNELRAERDTARAEVDKLAYFAAFPAADAWRLKCEKAEAERDEAQSDLDRDDREAWRQVDEVRVRAEKAEAEVERLKADRLALAERVREACAARIRQADLDLNAEWPPAVEVSRALSSVAGAVDALDLTPLL